MGKDSSGVVQLDGPADEIITSRFITFTDEMNVLLSAADLVIPCRCGSYAEIVRCRVPSILIRILLLPTIINCTMLVFLKLKGGLVCKDEDLTENLFKEVREMMFNEELRAILRRNLFAMDRDNSGSRIVDDMMQLVSGEKCHWIHKGEI